MSPAFPEAAKNRIIEWGRDLGLSAVKIAPAETTPRAEAMLEWIALGYHASMAYLARDPAARGDPQRILEGCRSVICCALEYEDQLPDPGKDDPAIARIARYAWGDDYHDVLGGKLDDLADRIQKEWPETRTRVAVDSSPVMDKAFAERAGLGWMGRHTCLIDRARGSFFFTGEIFTTLDLPADAPVANLCGTCMRCMDACPTGAIVESGVLDAGRCLAYWNIEHRGPIDPAFHGAMENWAFGCDICQDVCPWNKKKPRSSADPRFAPRPGNIGRRIEEWSGISPEEFRERFRASAVRRARHDGFVRNIEIVGENMRRRRRGGEAGG